MRVRTGSKRVVCNVWTDEAREAAAEARRAGATGAADAGGIAGGGGPPTSTTPLSRRIIERYVRGADDVQPHSTGEFTVRRGVYYRTGETHKGWEQKVSSQLTAAGVEHEVVGSGEFRAPSGGGSSIRSQSHWWVKIKPKASQGG
jgi:hypothetical protein